VRVYRDADLDLYGAPDEVRMACHASSGWALSPDDCNDVDPLSNPRSPERPDAADDDCDGQVDE